MPMVWDTNKFGKGLVWCLTSHLGKNLCAKGLHQKNSNIFVHKHSLGFVWNPHTWAFELLFFQRTRDYYRRQHWCTGLNKLIQCCKAHERAMCNEQTYHGNWGQVDQYWKLEKYAPPHLTLQHLMLQRAKKRMPWSKENSFGECLCSERDIVVQVPSHTNYAWTWLSTSSACFLSCSSCHSSMVPSWNE
jgi:hypothetical protein